MFWLNYISKPQLKKQHRKICDAKITLQIFILFETHTNRLNISQKRGI